jgi:uncharacterized SAM-binding protein YcdF (DUF218 family)
MKKFKFWFFSILILLFFDVIIAMLYFPYCDKQIQKYECQDKSGTIVVFFGDSEKNGNLGEMQLTRLNHALKIYNPNYNSAIICVGGNRADIQYYGSKKSKDYLVKKGISPKKIYYDTNSYDTRSNLREFYKLSEKYGFMKFIYVSDAIHLYRIADWSKENNFCLSPVESHFNVLQKIKYANYQWFSLFMAFMFSESQYDYLVKSYRNFSTKF